MGAVRWRDRQNHAFTLCSRNSADRNSTISSAGSIAAMTSRAERRGGPTFTRRPFGAADYAQPQAARSQCGSDSRRKLLSLACLIEHVKATPIEHEIEQTNGGWRGEKIQRSEAAARE